MLRKKKIKLLGSGFLLIILVLLSYEFLYGKFFPYTPVIIEFTRHELPHTLIYIQEGAEYNDFVRIDTLPPGVEDFHELKFLNKPKIFIFRDSSSFIKRSPSMARFCVHYRRLFISPWALKEVSEGKISLEIYLRHELSHSLLNSNTGIIHAYKYPAWLQEGIAVYSANQMGTSFYPNKGETYQAINQGNFMPPLDFKTSREDRVKLNVKYPITFMYSEFACIVDYLAETYGKEKLLTFIQKLLEISDNDEVFKGVYNIEFSEAILNFKKKVTDEKPH